MTKVKRGRYYGNQMKVLRIDIVNGRQSWNLPSIGSVVLLSSASKMIQLKYPRRRLES